MQNSLCRAAKPRRWVTRALISAVGAVSVVPAGTAWAGVSFGSGSDVTFRHDPDRDSSAVAPKIVEILDVPSSSGMPSYHISKTFTSGSSDTTAFGSLGHVTNSTTASFVLKPGTGVTQDDPSNAAYPGASSLKLNIDTVWSVTSGGFGPLATGYISLGVGGIVGDGGYAKVQGDLSFTDPTTGATLRSDWVFSRTFTDPGSFAKTFTTSEVFTGLALNSGQKIRVQGYVEFRASNAETPSEIVPTDIEIGGAPPTATWAGVQGGVWDDPRFWVQPDEPNPEALPPVPNQPGHRARFINQGRGAQQVFISKPVTIGTLDLDGTGAFTFVGEQPLTFQTLSGPAVLNVRNVQGAGAHGLLLPAVQFDSQLELKTDSFARLDVGSQMRGKGSLLKMGDGSVRLLNANAYTGGTAIFAGELHANATGALGTGPVLVGNGLLGYNAPRATSHELGVQVFDGGVVDLGVVPTSADKFTVRAGGTISGSGQELGALSIGENLVIQPGAMISHTDFNVSQDGNPKGLGTTPLYIFGLTESEFEQNFFMGSGAATPWRGIGGTRGDITFGTPNRVIGIASEGELLVPTGGTLRVNATVGVLGGGAGTLRKTGAGKAILTSPSNLAFKSLVDRGTLQIDGAHPGDVVIAPGAVLSGTGNIGGTVTMTDGIDGAAGPHIAPGASIGTLTVGNLELTPTTQLDFELNDAEQSDRINVSGNLVLDGHLNITEMPDFGPRSYRLLDFLGSVKDNGLEIGRASDAYAYEIKVVPVFTRPGGYVMLNVLGEKQWNVDGSGEWDDAGKWLGPVPNVAGSRANFLGKLTKGPADVMMSGDKTVGRMRFDNQNTYRLVAGAGGGSLRLDNGGEGALLAVESGRHEIHVPIVAVDDADIDVNENHVLTASGGITVNPGRMVKRTGEGILDVGPVTMAAGARFKANQGGTRAVNFRGGTLSIREGALVQVRSSDGTPTGTSKIDALTIEGETDSWEGRLDLRDNDLIVQATAATRQAVLSQLHNQVKHGRNSTGFLWGGQGIVTTSAARNPIVGLAVAMNDRGNGTPIFTDFSGQSVDVSSVLVKYTYNGDANLDGRVNADDYFRIDAGFLAQHQNPLYVQGDFNYDGKVNADDYFLIDQAFLGQGGVLDVSDFGGGALAAAAAVPEPSIAGLAAVACGALLRRRRRAVGR